MKRVEEISVGDKKMGTIFTRLFFFFICREKKAWSVPLSRWLAMGRSESEHFIDMGAEQEAGIP